MWNHVRYNKILSHEHTLKHVEDVEDFSHVQFARKTKIKPYNSKADNC